MTRYIGICVLIISFTLSSVTAGLATETMEISPIIVEPYYDLGEISQQMLAQDRINRDEELAITGLIDQNQKLTNTALARQQDAELEKINDTMIRYRDFLLSRDQARIIDNSQNASNYNDLVNLTRNVDDNKAVGQTLVLKKDIIEEKFKLLDDLKNEMIALNHKLKREVFYKDFDKIAKEQEIKTQLLTLQLADLDKKIAGYNQILAKKDRTIKRLRSQVAQLKSELKDKTAQENNQVPQNEIIKQQNDQIRLLKQQAQELSAKGNNQSSQDEIITHQQKQIDSLKTRALELTSRVNNQASQDDIIKQQRNQISFLKTQVKDLSSKKELIKEQSEQIKEAANQFENQGAVYDSIKKEIMALRTKLSGQSTDLEAKDESIHWLNKVLAVAKNKAEYYRLTSQKDEETQSQLQQEVQKIKDTFAQHFKSYDQFENAIVSLKTQVSQSSAQLSQKQQEVELLKAQLLKKNILGNDQENQINKMKADILAILQDRANKEIYQRNFALQLDNRVQLARQLIDLQNQEASLLNEKSDLEAAQNTFFDKYVMMMENKIKELLVKHQIQTAVLQNQLDELKDELSQKEQQASDLKSQLENKIADEQNQSILVSQIQDLKNQLQDKEDQITSMTTELQSGNAAVAQVESLKQQIVLQVSQVDSLKQELANKNAQSVRMTAMIRGYQHKLEASNNFYGQALQLASLSRDDKARMEKQIVDLNLELQEKEAQIIKIKKDIYDLRELTNIKDRDLQARDLSLSMIQQKSTDKQMDEYQSKIIGLQAINDKELEQVKSLRIELALAHQQLEGMPSRDEIEFLRTGLQKATLQLKQKDETILNIKANTDEYLKEFRKQTTEFQNLTEQLLDARHDLDRKDEDLKYKDLELTRLKLHFQTSEHSLKLQVKDLTRRIDRTQEELLRKTHGNRVKELLEQLKKAQLQIKDLQQQLNQLKIPSKNDPIREKLIQALDKIDQQGRTISLLTQKLEDAGQNVDLTHNTAK